MRLSCSLACLQDRPLAEVLPLVRDAGCEAIELWWPRVQQDLAGSGDAGPQFQTLLRASGLRLSGLMVSDMAVFGAAELADLTAELVRQMRLAQALDAPAVSLRGGDRRRQSLEMLVRGLQAILPAAEELDLIVELANADASRVEQLEDLRYVLFQIRHPRLRLLNDTGQFHDACVNPRDAFREFIEQTDAVRIADRRGRQPVPLGEGEVNVPAVIEHLQRVGYAGWLVIGPPVPQGMQAGQYLAQSVTYLRSLVQ